MKHLLNWLRFFCSKIEKTKGFTVGDGEIELASSFEGEVALSLLANEISVGIEQLLEGTGMTQPLFCEQLNAFAHCPALIEELGGSARVIKPRFRRHGELRLELLCNSIASALPAHNFRVYTV